VAKAKPNAKKSAKAAEGAASIVNRYLQTDKVQKYCQRSWKLGQRQR